MQIANAVVIVSGENVKFEILRSCSNFFTINTNGQIDFKFFIQGFSFTQIWKLGEGDISFRGILVSNLNYREGIWQFVHVALHLSQSDLNPDE